METIHIYHTNDVHSHLENWPRIQKFLSHKKRVHQEKGEDVFLFDIGDFIDRWHPFTEATKGQGNIDLLNESGYTAVTIGNNEGINLPYKDLDHLYNEAHFEVLVANLYQQNDKYPNWVKPYEIYYTNKGTRVGVIGLTAYFAHLYGLLGWQLTEPISELNRWLKPLKEESDIIILLSHLGIQDDEQIAIKFPEIDLILGAHTHHFLEHGKQVGNTLLGAAGKYGNFVGHVTLHLNEQKMITLSEALLYNGKDLPNAQHERESVNLWLEKGKAMLKQNVTTLSEPLFNDPFHETELSLILCKGLREWCAADCSILNAGLLLGSLSGTVTEYDLLTICPHPINPCVIELTGKELQDVLLQTKNGSWANKEIKGLGFRGTILGVFVYDRISFQGKTIFLDGEELNFGKNYTLALPDMFTFGHFFKEVFQGKQKKYFLPEFLRDILKWKLTTMY